MVEVSGERVGVGVGESESEGVGGVEAAGAVEDPGAV